MSHKRSQVVADSSGSCGDGGDTPARIRGQVACQQQQSATTTSEILAALDRQYSYENTVQGGRYRLDSSEVEEGGEEPDENTQDHNNDGYGGEGRHPQRKNHSQGKKSGGGEESSFSSSGGGGREGVRYHDDEQLHNSEVDEDGDGHGVVDHHQQQQQHSSSGGGGRKKLAAGDDDSNLLERGEHHQAQQGATPTTDPTDSIDFLTSTFAEAAAASKKSVRFHEYDPRLGWKKVGDEGCVAASRHTELETKNRKGIYQQQQQQYPNSSHPSSKEPFQYPTYFGYGEWVRKWRPNRFLSLVRKRMMAGLSWHSLRMLLIDWLFLAILGIGMALTSMFMDHAIELLQKVQLFLFEQSGHTGMSPLLSYLCTYLSWIGFTQVLVIASAAFVHYVAPQAVGSGIPEMKTILRGVILKDYLTLRTLVSKFVGLTLSLGSGIPIGKMGPFVHLASTVANLLSNMAARVEGAYSNESRKTEMLAAACATGVACTFSAPVGGVLFSIEVTTMYFSVRNYWRGFFAAACGATVFRLLRVVVFKSEVTLVAFYQTHFPSNSFEPEELPFFALIGLICGFAGAAWIKFYRSLVMCLRQHPFAKRFFQKNWLAYPALVAFIAATVTYPRGYGRFLSGRYKFTRTVLDFFSNCTWSKPAYSAYDSPHGCPAQMLASWTNHEGYGPYNVFLVLSLFTITFFFLAAICCTMPIPCGIFMPNFVVGAALGRLVGEVIATVFPHGIADNVDQPIFPGVYAVVGAAALTGAITHSVSVAMICCEITGQLIYIIPLMIAVIIANAVCAYFQPSIYDVMIKIKHLPYLPDIPPSNAAVHLITAEQIMVTPVKYLCRLTTYDEIRRLLVEMPRLRSFPIVEDPSSIMLLGSVSRRTLLRLLGKQVGEEARKMEARRRVRTAIETIDRHFRETCELAQYSSSRHTSSSYASSYVHLEEVNDHEFDELERGGSRQWKQNGGSGTTTITEEEKNVAAEENKKSTLLQSNPFPVDYSNKSDVNNNENNNITLELSHCKTIPAPIVASTNHPSGNIPAHPEEDKEHIVNVSQGKSFSIIEPGSEERPPLDNNSDPAAAAAEVLMATNIVEAALPPSPPPGKIPSRKSGGANGSGDGGAQHQHLHNPQAASAVLKNYWTKFKLQSQPTATAISTKLSHALPSRLHIHHHHSPASPTLREGGYGGAAASALSASGQQLIVANKTAAGMRGRRNALSASSVATLAKPEEEDEAENGDRRDIEQRSGMSYGQAERDTNALQASHFSPLGSESGCNGELGNRNFASSSTSGLACHQGANSHSNSATSSPTRTEADLQMPPDCQSGSAYFNFSSSSLVNNARKLTRHMYDYGGKRLKSVGGLLLQAVRTPADGAGDGSGNSSRKETPTLCSEAAESSAAVTTTMMGTGGGGANGSGGGGAQHQHQKYDAFDLTDEMERREWELTRLAEPLEIEETRIDPAPFQLVRRTSVYKVHSLFSLLDLNRAYVTDRGRLVGVVAMRDLRAAIERAQSGGGGSGGSGGKMTTSESVGDVEPKSTAGRTTTTVATPKISTSAAVVGDERADSQRTTNAEVPPLPSYGHSSVESRCTFASIFGSDQGSPITRATTIETSSGGAVQTAIDVDNINNNFIDVQQGAAGSVEMGESAPLANSAADDQSTCQITPTFFEKLDRMRKQVLGIDIEEVEGEENEVVVEDRQPIVAKHSTTSIKALPPPSSISLQNFPHPTLLALPCRAQSSDSPMHSRKPSLMLPSISLHHPTGVQTPMVLMPLPPASHSLDGRQGSKNQVEQPQQQQHLVVPSPAASGGQLVTGEATPAIADGASSSTASNPRASPLPTESIELAQAVAYLRRKSFIPPE